MQANNNTLGTNIELAVKNLKAGKLVAFPTETVYGLGADATNLNAIKSVFATKGRPKDHPLIVHISGVDKLDFWAKDIPDSARLLAKQFWPGPLTLILQKQDHVFSEITGGQATIALRVPQHAMTLELLKDFQGMVGPSANKYSKISPTSAQHVWEDLQKNIDHNLVAEKPLVNSKSCNKISSNQNDIKVKQGFVHNQLSANKTTKGTGNQEKNVGYILDGGDCEVGIESTIVDCTSNIVRVVRAGIISKLQIKDCLDQELKNVLSSEARLYDFQATINDKNNTITEDNAVVNTNRELYSNKNINKSNPNNVSFANNKEDIKKISKSEIKNHISNNNLRVPGNKESHYAPNTPLYLMNIDEIKLEIDKNFKHDTSFAVLSFNYQELVDIIKNLSANFNSNNTDHLIAFESSNRFFQLRSKFVLMEANSDPIHYAKELYKNLRNLDGLKFKKIIIERPSNLGLWAAILDRLQRASTTNRF